MAFNSASRTAAQARVTLLLAAPALPPSSSSAARPGSAAATACGSGSGERPSSVTGGVACQWGGGYLARVTSLGSSDDSNRSHRSWPAAPTPLRGTVAADADAATDNADVALRVDAANDATCTEILIINQDHHTVTGRQHAPAALRAPGSRRERRPVGSGQQAGSCRCGGAGTAPAPLPSRGNHQHHHRQMMDQQRLLLLLLQLRTRGGGQAATAAKRGTMPVASLSRSCLGQPAHDTNVVPTIMHVQQHMPTCSMTSSLPSSAATSRAPRSRGRRHTSAAVPPAAAPSSSAASAAAALYAIAGTGVAAPDGAGGAAVETADGVRPAANATRSASEEYRSCQYSKRY